MEIKIIILSIVAILLIIIIPIFVAISLKKKYKKEAEKNIQNFLQNEYQKEKEKFSERLARDEADRINELNRLNAIITEKQNFNDNLLQIRIDELDRLMDEKRSQAESLLTREIDEWTRSAQEAANYKSQIYQSQLQQEYDKKEQILTELQNNLLELQQKRDALNESILRAREMEEQQDFYRIQLEDSAKSDIRIINSVRDKLVHIELFNKLIFNNYIERPTKEMIKRVLGGTDTSGIYKVTNIQTKEIYIGKSTSISNRFLGHVKSACGLEGVADSQFQRALKKYGVDSFTWEVLEKVPKEKLTEREKYFINFYDTKKYGYNQREG